MNHPYLQPYYYNYGPRPFSGHDLLYYDIYILELMQAITMLCRFLRENGKFYNINIPSFWRYILEHDNQNLWHLARTYISDFTPAESIAHASPLQHGDEMCLAWASADPYLYGSADLMDEHNHAIIDLDGNFVVPNDSNNNTAISGYGKTIIGNYIKDLYGTLIAAITEYAYGTLDGGEVFSEIEALEWFTSFFKELGPYAVPFANQLPKPIGITKDTFLAPGGVGGSKYNIGEYNVNTDHVEILRVVPRSIVNMVDDTGACCQIDGRLVDYYNGSAYSAYPKTMKRADIVHSNGRISSFDQIAFIDAGIDEFFSLKSQYVEFVTWYDDELKRVTINHPEGKTPVDICYYKPVWESTGLLFVLYSDASIMEVDIYNTAVTGQYYSISMRTLFSVDNRLFRSYEIDPDSTRSGWWTRGFIEVSEENDNAINPSGISYIDDEYGIQINDPTFEDEQLSSHTVKNILLISDSVKPVIHVCAIFAEAEESYRSGKYVKIAEMPVGEPSFGICTETTTGLPKEGPPCSWRLLLGRGRNTIEAVNLYSNNPTIIKSSIASPGDTYLYAYPTGVLQYDSYGTAFACGPLPKDIAYRLIAPPEVSHGGWSGVRWCKYWNGTNIEVHLLISNMGAYQQSGVDFVDGREFMHYKWTLPDAYTLNSTKSINGYGVDYEYSDGHHIFGVINYELVSTISFPEEKNFLYGGSYQTHNFQWATVQSSTLLGGSPEFVIAARYNYKDGGTYDIDAEYITWVTLDGSSYGAVTQTIYDGLEYALISGGLIIRDGTSSGKFVDTVNNTIDDQIANGYDNLITYGFRNIHKIDDSTLVADESFGSWNHICIIEKRILANGSYELHGLTQINSFSESVFDLAMGAIKI